MRSYKSFAIPLHANTPISSVKLGEGASITGQLRQSMSLHNLEPKKRSSKNIIVEETTGRDTPDNIRILDKTHRKLKVCRSRRFGDHEN